MTEHPRLYAACPDCHGAQCCQFCNGSGMTPYRPGFVEIDPECSKCAGTGSCMTCEDIGYVALSTRDARALLDVIERMEKTDDV